MNVDLREFYEMKSLENMMQDITSIINFETEYLRKNNVIESCVQFDSRCEKTYNAFMLGIAENTLQIYHTIPETSRFYNYNHISVKDIKQSITSKYEKYIYKKVK